MARYRHKSFDDLAWNRIRRQITRDLDTEIANRREDVLNDLLSGAWNDYSASLKQGTVIELEAKYKNLVAEIVKDVVKAPELSRADLEKS